MTREDVLQLEEMNFNAWPALAAVGVASVERGWAGLHGIHVATDVRRQGVARKLSEALLGFSYARGARRAWLQVAQTNIAALPLYRSLRFQTVYSYHHRIRQPRGVTEST